MDALCDEYLATSVRDEGISARRVVGLTVSTVRWLVIDTLHHATGLRRPQWNYAKLQHNLGAYDRLEQNHYRYYQFYANMVMALPLA